MHARRRRDRGGLVPGLIMILVGTVFLLERFDYLEMRQVWRLWPLPVIAIGLLHLLRPRGGRPSIFVLMVGIWLQISTLELWNLDFGDSWPLLIIFVGVSFVFDALVGGRRAASRPAAGGGSPEPSQSGPAANEDADEIFAAGAADSGDRHGR